MVVQRIASAFSDFPKLNFSRNEIPFQPSEVAKRRSGYIDPDTKSGLPDWFPAESYFERQRIYDHYWRWYTGEALTDMTNEKYGDPIPKYPLAVNLIPNIAEKRAMVMAGEALDTAQPIVTPTITPRPTAKLITDADRELAFNLQRDLIQVWMQNNARAIQMENMKTGQFLGGAVFQVTWNPDELPDEIIPIRIKRVPVDFFVPQYRYDDMWNLIEAHIAYKITLTEAKDRFGEVFDVAPIYIERWTKTTYEVWVNDKKVQSGKNEFGFVPFVYIPTDRAGSFFGESFIPYIENLIKEYNGRMADIGDSIAENAHPTRYARNVDGVSPIPLDDGRVLIDIGEVKPHSERAIPEVITEPVTAIPDSLVNWPPYLHQEILRLVSLSKIAYGEDEGSQRSALTMAFRMWPLTAKVNLMRTQWDVGLTLIAKMIIKIMIAKQSSIELGYTIPRDVLKSIQIGQAWNPMIPRDREQIVNEIILLSQANRMSLHDALTKRGDVSDIDDEMNRIFEDLKKMAELASLGQPQKTEAPPTDVSEPVASTGVEE